MPASCTRRANQRGLGRVGSTPVTVRATKIGQARGLELDRVPGGDLQRHRPIDRIGEGDAGGLGRLAGQAADGEAVAPVGGDRDIEHVIAQLEQRRGIGPRQQAGVGQHHDPAVVVPETQLGGRADHPVGDVPVRLAGGDGEAAGEHRPGQRDDDEVPDVEVAGPADDPRRESSMLCGPTSTWHQRMVLPFFCGSSTKSSTRPMTSGPVTSGPGLIDRLDLETGADQRGGQSSAVQILRQGRVLAQPAQRGPHRASPTRARLNRTSPSIMSRMSSELLRNIRVRSTPIPKANPV